MHMHVYIHKYKHAMMLPHTDIQHAVELIDMMAGCVL